MHYTTKDFTAKREFKEAAISFGLRARVRASVLAQHPDRGCRIVSFPASEGLDGDRDRK